MKQKALTLILTFFTAALFAQEKVNFTKNFQQQNQGKYKIEVNELSKHIHVYCKDHYDEKTFNTATADIIALMTDRGFQKMNDFITKLFKVYAQNENKKIDEWYPQFLSTFNS